MQVKDAAPVVREEPHLFHPDGKAVKPWMVLLSLMIGVFMALLDGTIVNIAFTAIQNELNSDATTTSWVLNAYSLVFAVLLVTAGRFADQFGRKRMFMTGMVLFSLGSLLCALSPSIEWLIGFRALQAIGAAALNPISLAIITVVFPEKKRGAAIGMWGGLTGLAMGLGPIIGGFLVENFEWRSIFFVNIPFCIAGLIMVWINVPESRDPTAPKGIDLPGTLLMSAGLFALALGIMNGNSWGWGSPSILGLFGGALLAFILFYLIELKQEHPIIDFKLFKISSFTGSSLAMLLFGIGIQASMLILVLYFISGRGYSELDAAYALLPMPVAGFLVSGMFSGFSNKVSLRMLGIVGLLMSGGGLMLLSLVDYQASYWDVMWRSVLSGMGLGLCFMTFSSVVLSEVPHGKVGVGSGVFNTFRQVGFALGVAIMISFFTGAIKDNMVEARSRAVAIVQSDTAIPQPVRNMISDQFKASSNQPVKMGQGAGMPQMNLAAMAEKMPGGQALLPQLNDLSKRIGDEFNKAVVESFAATWRLGGIFVLLGVIPAALARKKKPEKSV